MSPSRPVRRAGVAGITVALLTSTALVAAPAMAGGPVPEQPAPEQTSEAGNAVAEAVDPGAAEAPEEAPAVEEQAVPIDALIVIGLSGSYDTSGAHALLDRINEIRAEAAAEGITVDGVPVSGAPLAWSPELEGIAQQRAAEVSFSFSHERPDGSGRLTALEGNGFQVEVLDENLALSEGTLAAVEDWYAEKQAYLDFLATGLDTGNFARYATLISDEYGYVGIASFTLDSLYEMDLEDPTLPLERFRAAEVFGAEEGAQTIPGMGYVAGTVGTGGTAVVALFSATPSGEAATLPDGPAIVPIEVTPGYIVGSVEGPSSLVEGETGQAVAQAVAGVDPWGGSTTIQGDVSESISITWSSSDPSVAIVDEDGTVTAVAPGTAQISATTAGMPLGTFTVTVEEAPVVPVSVSNPEPVSTESGRAPELPASASVEWSNGERTEEPIAWEAVDPALYGARLGGSFEVEGSVEGWGSPVACRVEVEPAAPVGASPLPPASTEEGLAPELPASASVEWSNGERTEEPIAWEGPDPESYARAGSFEARGAAAGVPVACEVEVRAPTVASVDAPAPVATPAGSAPELPASVGASMSNGSAAELPVEWGAVDPSAYSGRLGGSFEVEGSVEGWGSPVRVEVEVLPAEAVSARAAGPASTVEGLAPELPASASVEWSNGERTEEPIAWEAVDPALYARPGSFEVEGAAGDTGLTVGCEVEVSARAALSAQAPGPVSTEAGRAPELPGSALVRWDNGQETEEAVAWEDVRPQSYAQAGTFVVKGAVGDTGLTVGCEVEVSAPTVASVDALAPVSTEAGTAPELPASASVAWSNGRKTKEPIAWDPIRSEDYARGGQFTAEGTVCGLPISCEVTVAPAYVTAVATPSPVTTASGRAPELPASASVEWSNGERTEEPIAWEAVDPALYGARLGGSFEVEGSVEGWGSPVACRVEVEPAAPVGASPLPPASTEEGLAPELPASASVEWSNGERTEEPIAWEGPDPESYARAGSFEARGAAAGVPVACEVEVRAPTVASVDAPAPVATPAGSAPELPASVGASMSNGSAAELPVEWGAVDPSAYSGRLGGSFEVEGSVEGWGSPVRVEVEVLPAEAVSARAAGPASTVEGLAPELPASASVEWSNGERTEEPIAWEAVDPALYARPGSFEVEGAAGDTGLTVGCEVEVSARAALSAQAPGPVSTEAGRAPELPGSALVRWDNGQETEEAVAWEKPNPASYHDGGSFNVEGLVETAGLTVTVEVDVAPAVAASCVEASLTTPAGVMPQLPSSLEVLWSNGDRSDEAVSWPALDAESYAVPGELTVEGTFDNPKVGLVAQALVSVGEPVVVGIDEPPAVETTAGVRPSLPTEVTARFSDGASLRLPVVWADMPAASYHSVGSFGVEGTVEGYDAPVGIEIHVAAALPQWVQPVYVTTAPRTAPVLPDTVRIVWANGETTYEPVQWKGVSPTQYSRPGTFTVNGVAADQDIQATVTVAEPQERPVTNTPGDIAPTGDETGRHGVLATWLSAAGAAVVAASAALLHHRRRSDG